MKRLPICLLTAILLATSPGLSAHDDFESTFMAKRKADISFAQLMQIMHQATSMMLDGILYENKEMVALGAHLLDEHPAPALGPGVAIVPERRKAFEGVMPAYDKIFHGAAHRVRDAAAKGQWNEAYAGYREITDACVACHDVWRPHALSRQDKKSPP